MTKFDTIEICKVDESLGLIFGWAVICKKDGQDYFDLQDHHIPENVMLKASFDFMKAARLAKEMHAESDGSIVFAFPMTTEIAKALNINTNMTGLLIAHKPERAETLEKAKNGDYRGFSIGGELLDWEDVK